MAVLFHLLRHGDYALVDSGLGGRGCYALSPRGHAQAERIAAAFEHAPAAVVSSPVPRARETAEHVARHAGLAVEVDPAFAEIDYAAWTGQSFAALAGDPAWSAWNSFRGTAGVPGGETMLAVQGRALAGLLRHAARYPDGEIVVVSHGDVIKAMLAHFLGMPLDLLRRLEIAPASVSRLRLWQDDARVLAVNA